MKSAIISGVAAVAVLVFLLFAGTHRAVEPAAEVSAASGSAAPSAARAAGSHSVLYGRVTTDDGATYEGRLRFGGGEEAFWNHYFNGAKAENPWASYVPRELLTEPRPPFEVFGFKIALGDRQINLGRPFMARFGDITRIEARGRDLRVTLKSGTVFPLDRYAADDFADGLRVWDRQRGVVDFGEWRIRSIELLPGVRDEGAPSQLHGTVRTAHGTFTGFIQWDREGSVGADELIGNTADGAMSLRFDTIRSIARRTRDSALITLLDGRDIVLSNTSGVGRGHRGISVDDPRYSRVISWDAFERVDFTAGGSGPAYTDFPPGRPLMGSVTTRSGRRFAGRLVYDLDESETTETLDAPLRGVDYSIPFGLIASIAPAGRDDGGDPRATVTLHDGEVLHFEPGGDLGDLKGGLLIFGNGGDRPEHVAWTDVAQVDFDPPAAIAAPPRAR